MRLIHISDLHLGRRFNEISLIEDQAFILNQIIEQCIALKADALLISGDVYDKNSPSEQSFQLWNDFLERVAEIKLPTLVISGNHDSQERLGVTSKLIEDQGIIITSKYQGSINTVTLSHNDIDVQFALLPFIRPSDVRNYHDDFSGSTYNEAIERVLIDYDFAEGKKHVLLSHQFVIDGSKEIQLSDSEVGPMVGGIDAIHAHWFDCFDYVALGHIHKPQPIRTEFMRYSGSPLKYSISEAKDTKVLVIVDFNNDGIDLSYEAFKPLRDVRVLKGTLNELLEAAPKSGSLDLIHAILIDDEPLLEPMMKLQAVYPNCVSLELKPQTQVQARDTLRSQEIIQKKPIDLLSSFYEEMLAKEMSETSKKIVEEVILETEEH